MFSYDQTFDELLTIFRNRLVQENLSDKLQIDDAKHTEIIQDSKRQFAEDASTASQLNEDLASFATAFFLPKNSTLIINRLKSLH